MRRTMPCSKWPLSLLLSTLTLMGCATHLPPPSTAVAPVRIPSQPVSNEPPPPGTYWRMVCAYRQTLQAQLSLTLPKFDQCEGSTPPSIN